MLADARQTFAPEFLNRLDATLVFHPLDEDTLRTITRQLLAETGQRLDKLGISMEVEDEAVALLAEKGSDREYGARPLRRAIAAMVEDPAAELMLSGQLREGGAIKVLSRDRGVKVELV